MLAETFGVTVDWMLSENEEMPEEKVKINTAASSQTNTNATANWVESVPGVIGKLLRKYGWLFGVYIAVGGGVFVIFGLIVHFALNSMSSMVDNTVDSMFSGFEDEMIVGFGDGFGSSTFQSAKDTMSDMVSNGPGEVLGIAMFVIGVIMIFAGVALAVILRKKAKLEN